MASPEHVSSERSKERRRSKKSRKRTSSSLSSSLSEEQLAVSASQPASALHVREGSLESSPADSTEFSRRRLSSDSGIHFKRPAQQLPSLSTDPTSPRRRLPNSGSEGSMKQLTTSTSLQNFPQDRQSFPNSSSEDSLKRLASQSKPRFPNSNSEDSIKLLASFHDCPSFQSSTSEESVEHHPRISPYSSTIALGSYRSSCSSQRRKSEPEVKLPPILPVSSTQRKDESRSRSKKHSKGSGREGKAGGSREWKAGPGEGAMPTSEESRKSSRSSVSSVVSQQEEVVAEEQTEGVETVAGSQMMIMNPPPHIPFTEPEAFPSTASILSPGEESTNSLYCAATQETIEGAGMYDPNINRLPEDNVEMAEDRELKIFSDILTNATTMMVKDTVDRVKRQHSKVIERYREQVTTLQEEHQAEVRYLEKQVELEQSRNREGTAIQQSLSNKLQQNRAELKEQAENLQQVHKEYEIKRDQVAELRERLYESERELGKVRNDLTEQKEKMSEMLPVAPSQAHHQMMTDMTKTSQLLDSILRLMPDEKMIKEELERRQRLKQRRPVTTSLIKEPGGHRGSGKSTSSLAAAARPSNGLCSETRPPPSNQPHPSPSN